MKKCLVVFLSMYFLFASHCMAGTVLDNPDGFHMVNSKGIQRIWVRLKYKNGAYLLKLSNVKHKHMMAIGELIGGGWWYPSHKQFNLMHYLEFSNRSDCNGFWEEGAFWTSTVVADNKIPLGGGQTCRGYRFTGKSPKSRKAPGKDCKTITVEGQNCNPRCTEWYKDDGKKGYIVYGEKNAYRIYEYLNRN